METKRTQKQLLEDTFKCMWRMGDLTLTTVMIHLRTGGVVEKTFYKVSPTTRRKQ